MNYLWQIVLLETGYSVSGYAGMSHVGRAMEISYFRCYFGRIFITWGSSMSNGDEFVESCGTCWHALLWLPSRYSMFRVKCWDVHSTLYSKKEDMNIFQPRALSLHILDQVLFNASVNDLTQYPLASFSSFESFLEFRSKNPEPPRPPPPHAPLIYPAPGSASDVWKFKLQHSNMTASTSVFLNVNLGDPRLRACILRMCKCLSRSSWTGSLDSTYISARHTRRIDLT